MGIADQLNALRRDFPACRLVTFADLSSGLVLFSSSDQRVPQDDLDALCDRAREVFGGSVGNAAAVLIGGPVQQVVLSDSEGLIVLVRSPSEPTEAIVSHCSSDVDISAFTLRAARELAALGNSA
jgi:hypothetical protein